MLGSVSFKFLKLVGTLSVPDRVEFRALISSEMSAVKAIFVIS
jgi:hypothetical protein